jgi:hypothetical protein
MTPKVVRRFPRSRLGLLAGFLLAATTGCDRAPDGGAATAGGSVSITTYETDPAGGSARPFLSLSADGRALLSVQHLGRSEIDTYVGTWSGGPIAVSIVFSWTHTWDGAGPGETVPEPEATTPPPLGKAIELRVEAEIVGGRLTARPAPPMESLTAWKRVRTDEATRKFADNLFARR